VTLRMVLEKYDARKVRAHVRRFREVLMNPPIPQGIDAEAAATADKLAKAEAAAAKANANGELDEKAQKEFNEKQLQKLRDIHKNLEGVEVPVVADLGAFYAMAPKPSSSKRSPDEPTKEAKTTPSKKNKGKKKSGAKSPTAVNEVSSGDESSTDFSLESAKLPQCIKSIVFSGYNPPPGPRKLAGDLMYLEVTTEDNVMFNVTAHVNGFYVNRSTPAKFDPQPRADATTENLLVDVLLQASSKFKTSYESLLSKAAVLAKQGPVSIEWMVAAGNQISGKLPWNTPTLPTVTKHEYNLNRAEDELCATFGVEERGVLRDWNEEYQCCRDLPAETLRDQIVRSRVMYKIVNEFVEAATQGAVAIVEGHIPPINPMDEANSHVYVFNNIFFSLSVDGKPGAKDISTEEAAFSSANRDLQGVKAFNDADIPGLHTLATTVVDYLGMRVIAQSVIPGILQGEASSKLVYGSVDGGKTIASNEKMHALMQQAAEKLHIAERSIQPLGKDENEEDATPEADRASGVNGGEATTAVVKLCGPVEAKGILGADGRMYVLDLVRITPKDATYYAERDPQATPEQEDVTNGTGLRFNRQDEGYVAVLRPELVKLYALWKQNQIRKARREERGGANTAEANKKEDAESTEASADGEADKKDDDAQEAEEPVPSVRLSPNVFMKYASSTDADEAKADEAAARDAADYLQNVVIPSFVADIRRGAISPADGYALSELMHSCGINMRYLGRMAALVKKLESFGGISKYILELLEVEMITRAVKHIVADLLNADTVVRAAPGDALVRLLNAIFGGWEEVDAADEISAAAVAKTAGLSDTNPNKKTAKKNKKKTAKPVVVARADNADENGLDGVAVWQRITTQIQQRFAYTLALWHPYTEASTEDNEDESATAKFKRVQKNVLLRRLCQRLGLRVASKTYDFASAAPFKLEDITGVVPVVKHSLPAHPLAHAKQLLERGRLHLSGGALGSAYELLQEASTLLYHVVGGAHEDAALCSSSIATVLYHAGDVAGAIVQQQRALALYTQLQGIDYHDTAFAHANLALFFHANSQTDLAVFHLRRAIYLLELCGGPHYPEVSSLYLRMGSMCQDIAQVPLALLCYRESLQRGEFDRVQAANTLHQMALACSLVGGYRDALLYEKRVHALLQDAYGDNDPRVQEAAKFIKRFTEHAVEGAKGRKEVDAAAAADAIAQELLNEIAIKEESAPGKKKKNAKANGGAIKKH
jgi:protein TIF31